MIASDNPARESHPFCDTLGTLKIRRQSRKSSLPE
jgi:hypothetical protein